MTVGTYEVPHRNHQKPSPHHIVVAFHCYQGVNLNCITFCFIVPASTHTIHNKRGAPTSIITSSAWCVQCMRSLRTLIWRWNLLFEIIKFCEQIQFNCTDDDDDDTTHTHTRAHEHMWTTMNKLFRNWMRAVHTRVLQYKSANRNLMSRRVMVEATVYRCTLYNSQKPNNT